MRKWQTGRSLVHKTVKWLKKKQKLQSKKVFTLIKVNIDDTI